MKAQCLPLDIINTLPQTIIETILCFLPIRDAVRTSILSKKWRYNWINITKLVFDEDQLSKRCNLFYTIYRVMLLHHGPLLEFTLSISALKTTTSSEIDLVILHLLRKITVKKFALNIHDVAGYKLPSSFFSLKQLTHLNLRECKLLPPSTFNGFGSLTSLVLDYVETTKKTLLHLISNCPLLENFTLFESDDRYLSWDEKDSNIIDLFAYLPSIEYLSMNYDAMECFLKGRVPRELPTSLAQLKYFHLLVLDMSKYELSFAFLLMRSSPKLEKIKIEIDSYLCDRSQLIGLIEDDTDVCLDHLTELEIINFSNFISELEFVKLILVKSPMLKRVHIEPDCDVSVEEELKMLRILLRFPRASPLVQIIVERR